MANEIEILDIDDTPTTSTALTQERRNLSEELATAVLGRLQDTQGLRLAFLDSNLTAKQKLEAIVEFKTAMLIPSLAVSLGLNFNPTELKGSHAVMELLTSVENSIMALIKYEETEIINFNHVKISNSYKMLFDLIIEILQEEVKDQILINNFIEKVAVRCVGIEQEFNKAFKNVSNRMADLVENPLTAKFKNRDRDAITLLKRTAFDLRRLQAIGLSVEGLEDFLATIESQTAQIEAEEQE